jgi:hypothetical protein
VRGGGGATAPPNFFLGGALPPKNFEKKTKNTLDLKGFQFEKKYTLALLVFFIKFAPLKKILDPQNVFLKQKTGNQNMFLKVKGLR